MQIIAYDKTFDGFLSAVFDIYEYKFSEIKFSNADPSLFGTVHCVTTDEVKVTRVWNGIVKRVSNVGATQLYHTFLSEQSGVEDLLFRYIRYAFGSTTPVSHNFSHEAVLAVTQIAKKVHREKHRMEAFVRFKLTKDQLYYAVVEPDFDVLPLIVNHFKKRYADQRWMIYDVKRKYGIYYDLKDVMNITLDIGGMSMSSLEAIEDDNEPFFQQMWQNYFRSVNIPSRKNMKLHIQHMPTRYWKFLPEKRPF